MNKKVIFNSLLVYLLALSLVFVSCDNETTPGGDDGYVFTIQGITDDQISESWSGEVEGSGGFLVGFFIPGTSDNDIKSAAHAYVSFYKDQPPASFTLPSLKAYFVRNYASLGSFGNKFISGTLIDCATGQNNFATKGTYDVWLIIHGFRGPLIQNHYYQGYKLANLVVQGDTTKNALEFTKVITDF
jgi:hypothetical protein